MVRSLKCEAPHVGPVRQGRVRRSIDAAKRVRAITLLISSSSVKRNSGGCRVRMYVLDALHTHKAVRRYVIFSINLVAACMCARAGHMRCTPLLLSLICGSAQVLNEHGQTLFIYTTCTLCLVHMQFGDHFLFDFLSQLSM